MAEEQIQIQRVTFDVKEAAAYLGISTWLMYELIKRKEIHPIKAGHRYLFRQKGLDAWMNRQEEGKIEEGKVVDKLIFAEQNNNPTSARRGYVAHKI